MRALLTIDGGWAEQALVCLSCPTWLRPTGSSPVPLELSTAPARPTHSCRSPHPPPRPIPRTPGSPMELEGLSSSPSKHANLFSSVNGSNSGSGASPLPVPNSGSGLTASTSGTFNNEPRLDQLDEEGVAGLLASLGFPYYEEQLRGQSPGRTDAPEMSPRAALTALCLPSCAPLPPSLLPTSGSRALLAHAEHGITGEILIHLDHEALRDVGIHSVGQRLAILRAVWERKVAQNIPVEDGGWRPPGEQSLASMASGLDSRLASATCGSRVPVAPDGRRSWR